MTDLISREAAVDKFEPWLKVKGYSEGELNMLKAVLYELRFLPSAQPEIIRCKDCKFWGARGLCQIWDEYISNESFYCGCAERRTDE